MENFGFHHTVILWEGMKFTPDSFLVGDPIEVIEEFQLETDVYDNGIPIWIPQRELLGEQNVPIEQREVDVMACEFREMTGTCGHSQCPVPEQSGYECIDIVQGFCEVGEDCVKDCPYSWSSMNKGQREMAEQVWLDELKLAETVWFLREYSG